MFVIRFEYVSSSPDVPVLYELYHVGYHHAGIFLYNNAYSGSDHKKKEFDDPRGYSLLNNADFFALTSLLHSILVAKARVFISFNHFLHS